MSLTCSFLGDFKWFSHFVQLKAEFFSVKYLFGVLQAILHLWRENKIVSQPGSRNLSSQFTAPALNSNPLACMSVCLCTKILICEIDYVKTLLSVFDSPRFLRPLQDCVPWFPDRASRSQSGACVSWRRVCKCPLWSWIRGRRLSWPRPAVVDAGSEIRTQFLPVKPSELRSVPDWYGTRAQVRARERYKIILYYYYCTVLLLYIFVGQPVCGDNDYVQ